MAFDLVIKGGTVVDGSGLPRYRADVGVKDGVITEIGRIRAPSQKTVDAEGMVVSPGFIDGHTHMDAQIAWDPLGSCSCWHGVTTAVMGNCGFALAPCKPEDREWYARCMEAVEDIPTAAMLDGIAWNWETFPDYLDNLEALPKGINYASYIAHSALRMYAMGERALSEKANEDDLRTMANAVREAMLAGSMGFSTSRASTHVTPDGRPIASRVADWKEVAHLVGVMTEMNAGIFQVSPDFNGGPAHRRFLDELRPVVLESGRPVMFGVASIKQGADPNPWQHQFEWMDSIANDGARVYGQTTTKSINAIFSAKSYLPFDVLPAWKEVRELPIAEQQRRFRDPKVRARLVAAEAGMKPRGNTFQGGQAATTDPRKPDYTNLYAMRDVKWDDPTIAQLAEQKGANPVEVMMDLIVANENQVFVQPLVNNEPDEVLAMLRHPRALSTFSDSGAHVCQEMGSSLQTHMLSYWVREKQAFSLEEAVRKLTFDNASAWEMYDRGLVRTGMKADLLVFDADKVQPAMPTVETDLPGGARRLVQKATGIAATVVNGAVTLVNGESQGETPGQVIRGRLASALSD
jgi:N-acyl-D-amino-acid deacylase